MGGQRSVSALKSGAQHVTRTNTQTTSGQQSSLLASTLFLWWWWFWWKCFFCGCVPGPPFPPGTALSSLWFHTLLHPRTSSCSPRFCLPRCSHGPGPAVSHSVVTLLEGRAHQDDSLASPSLCCCCQRCLAELGYSVALQLFLQLIFRIWVLRKEKFYTI